MNHIFKHHPDHPTLSAPIGDSQPDTPRHNLGSWIEDQGDGLGSIALVAEVKSALQACAAWHKTPQVVVRYATEPALFRKAGLILSMGFQYTPLNSTGFLVDPTDVNSGPHGPEPCTVLETRRPPVVSRFADWTQQLSSNRKEWLLISGIGSHAKGLRGFSYIGRNQVAMNLPAIRSVAKDKFWRHVDRLDDLSKCYHFWK